MHDISKYDHPFEKEATKTQGKNYVLSENILRVSARIKALITNREVIMCVGKPLRVHTTFNQYCTK